MSVSNNYPNIKPSLLLDFANTGTLDPRITFARASTATYYDGVTTAKAEENLLLQSQDFTTSWDLSNGVTATANTAVAPDGTTTADTLAETATTSIHTAIQAVTTSGVVTMSVFAKPDSGTPFLTIGFNKDTSHYCSATFDLGLGTSTQTQVAGNYSGASATITLVAQGFYRCTLTVTTDSVVTARVGLNNTGTPTASNRGFGVNYLGVVTNSIYLWGAQLEQRSAVSSYTATTTQPITNYIPVLQTASANVARFDHNPTTGEALGLLIEEQRTNLLFDSENLAAGNRGSNTGWYAITRSSISANLAVAPDGALTADKLVEDTSTGTHFAANRTPTGSTTNTNPLTVSAYIKAAGRSIASILLTEGVTFARNAQVYFDLAAGTATTPITSGGASAATATVSSVGNGWYRCTLTVTLGGTDTQVEARFYSATSTTSASYTGNGYDGIYIWGAQLEAGAFSTSYIATTSAQVTRLADAASMTGTNFSSWYNQGEGTAYVSASRLGSHISGGGNFYLLNFSDGTSSNRLSLNTGSTDPLSRAFVIVNGGVQQTNITKTVSSATEFFAYSVTYNLNDCAFTLNGEAVSADTSATIPTVSGLNIAASWTGTLQYSGHLRKLSYYPQRLSDTNLVALTS